MSDSELDFESADEGGEDIDLELSDLSDDDDDDQKPAVKKPDEETKVPAKAPAEAEKEPEKVQESDGDSEEPAEEKQQPSMTDVVKDEPQKPMERDESEVVAESRPAQEEANKFDVEGDDEIDRLLDDMGIKESDVAVKSEPTAQPPAPPSRPETKKEEIKVKPVEQTKPAKVEAPPAKKVEVVSTGWDDTEFSDVDAEDDDVKQSAPPPKPQPQPPKPAPVQPPAARKEAAPSEPAAKTKDIAALFSSIQPKASAPEAPSSGGGGGGGGGGGWSWSKLGTSFMSSATALLETVEGAIGAPDPAELAAKVAKAQAENEKALEEEEAEPEAASDEAKQEATGATVDFNNDWDNNDWFTLPKQLNKLATTGTQLVSSSLGVLESVGKTTIEVINNKDPNLKQTREFFKTVPLAHNTSLSDLLREAQASSKAGASDASADAASGGKTVSPVLPDKLTFSIYFEEYKGVVNLEALDMLSKQTALKIEAANIKSSLFKKLSPEKQAQLRSIEQIFEEDNLNLDNNEDDDDDDEATASGGAEEDELARLAGGKDKAFDADAFEHILGDYASKLNLRAHSDKLLGAFKTSSFTINEVDDAVELRSQSVRCFALLTAKLIEFYHKAAESFLVDYEDATQQPARPLKGKPAVQLSLVNEKASNFYRLTRVFLKSLSVLADDFARKCRRIGKERPLGDSTGVSVNQIISDIYLEASNCNTYISDAFLLFLPFFKIHFMSKAD